MNIKNNLFTGPHKAVSIIICSQDHIKQSGYISDYGWKLMKMYFKMFYEILK